MVALPGSNQLRNERGHSGGGARLYAAAALAAVAVAGSTALALSADKPLAPRLAVTEFSVEIGDGSEVNASISVTNNTEQTIEGRVGWLVSVPGGDPWDQRVYQSTTKDVLLARGESVDLEWFEIAPVPTGNYRFQAWSHVTHGEESSYSDAVELAAGNLRFDATTPLLRIGPPSDLLRIESVEIMNDSPEGQLAALVGLSNMAGAERPVEIRVELLDTAADDPLWWKSGPADVVFKPLTVSGDSFQAIQVAKDLALPPGDYTVRVSITNSGGEPQLDRVLVVGEVYAAPEFGAGVARTAPPDGPLAIESVDVQPVWASREQSVVTVVVSNRSAETVQGIVWWHLGDPGDPEPWNHASATSYRLELVFAPGETKVVRLAAEGAVPNESNYELSLWVHEGELGSSTQSDGIRYDGAIEVDVGRIDG